MGGVGFQEFFILVFSFFAIIFHSEIRRQVRQGIEGASSALPLLHAMYAVLILITVGQSMLLQGHGLTLYEGENHLSAHRVRPRIQNRHS
jgi:hypothetical protein